MIRALALRNNGGELRNSPQGTPNCGHDAMRPRVCRARPFHRHQHRAAPFAPNADPLQETKDGHPLKRYPELLGCQLSAQLARAVWRNGAALLRCDNDQTCVLGDERRAIRLRLWRHVVEGLTHFLLVAVLTASVLSFVSIPLFGHISDRIGRKAMYMIGAFTTGVFGFIYFGLLNTGSAVLIFLAIVLSLIPHDMQYGPQAA